MEAMELHHHLQENPGVFPDKPKKVSVIETHISYVFLTGRYAYKIKKPVNFGFLDFSTIKKRKEYCEKELSLNGRLSPDIYLQVLPITKNRASYEFLGKGDVAEYCLQMKELPQDRILTRLIKEGKCSAEIIDAISDILESFFSNADTTEAIRSFGNIDVIKKNTEENFEQTKGYIGKTIEETQYNLIAETTRKFIDRNAGRFQSRVDLGFIRDCHGDLHTGNIFVTDNTYIFDCIEFNDRFRYQDILSDIGFLSMDLDHLDRPDYARQLEKRFAKEEDKSLLFFYKCYRAYVRFKIACFQLADNDTEELRLEAEQYAGLATVYASSLRNLKPCMIILTGLSATGKSYWARKLGKTFDIKVLRTDKIRKNLFEDCRSEGYGEGMYSDKAREHVYDKMLEYAKAELGSGRAIILDATFEKEAYRKKARELAAGYDVPFVMIMTSCPDNSVSRRMEKRKDKPGLSQADYSVYEKQKHTYEIPADVDVQLDTSSPKLKNAKIALSKLYQMGLFARL